MPADIAESGGAMRSKSPLPIVRIVNGIIFSEAETGSRWRGGGIGIMNFLMIREWHRVETISIGLDLTHLYILADRSKG
jgi:hypothetical protein